MHRQRGRRRSRHELIYIASYQYCDGGQEMGDGDEDGPCALVDRADVVIIGRS